MFKKSLSVILAIVLTLGMLSASAVICAGAKESTAAATGSGVYDASQYGLWVGGVEVTSANASSITGKGVSGKISYDASTATLTLNNATITGTVGNLYLTGDADAGGRLRYNIDHSSIYSAKAVTIELIGKNVIKIDEGPQNNPTVDFDGAYRGGAAFGISAAEKNVTISGSGSLTMSGEDYNMSGFTIGSITGICADKLTVSAGTTVTTDIKAQAALGVDVSTLNVSGTLNASAHSGVYIAHGIEAFTVNVAKSGRLVAKAPHGNNETVGIYLYQTAHVTVNGTVITSSNLDDHQKSYGICSTVDGKININESGHLEANGGNAALARVVVELSSQKLKIYSGEDKASAVISTPEGSNGKRYVRIQTPPPVQMNKCTVGNIKNKVYTGKALGQSPVVKYGSKTLKKGTDYTCAYSDNTKIGAAVLIITGKGNYTGTVKKTFKILPAAVGKVSIKNTAGGAKLSWNKATGAASYKVYCKSGSSWKLLEAVKTNSFTHKKAASGKKYTYTVRSVDKSGKYPGAYSAKGWTNTFIAAPKAPALKNTGSGIQVSWKKVSGAAKYRVFRKTGNGTWKKLANTTSLKITDKTAKNGTTYAYTVRCISKDGKSYTSAYDANGVSIKCKK